MYIIFVVVYLALWCSLLEGLLQLKPIPCSIFAFSPEENPQPQMKRNERKRKRKTHTPQTTTTQELIFFHPTLHAWKTGADKVEQISSSKLVPGEKGGRQKHYRAKRLTLIALVISHRKRPGHKSCLCWGALSRAQEGFCEEKREA